MNRILMRYPGWAYVLSQLLNALLFAAAMLYFSIAAGCHTVELHEIDGLSREQKDLLRISEVCAEKYRGYVARFEQAQPQSYKVICRRGRNK